MCMGACVQGIQYYDNIIYYICGFNVNIIVDLVKHNVLTLVSEMQWYTEMIVIIIIGSRQFTSSGKIFMEQNLRLLFDETPSKQSDCDHQKYFLRELEIQRKCQLGFFKLPF